MPTHEGRGTNPAYRWFVVVLLMLTYVLNQADRVLLSILAEPIKNELALSDTSIAMLSGLSLVAIYATLGIPVAWYADRMNRAKIIAVACAVWSVFSTACGFAASFWQLVVLRFGVGVGEAGGTSPAHSLIADMFPRESRARALSLFTVGSPIGITLAAVAGSWLAAHYGWRSAFIAFGIPGALLGVAIFFLVRDPKRAAQQPAAVSEPATDGRLFATIRECLKSRDLLLISFAGGISCTISHGFNSWLPAFLVRERGMELTDVGSYYGFSLGISLFIAIWLGGYLIEKTSKRYPSGYMLIPLIAGLLCIPLLVLTATTTSWPLVIAFFFAFNILSSLYFPVVVFAIQDRAPDNRRTLYSALMVFILNIIGYSGGPLYVGIISDMVGGPNSLETGLLWLTAFFPILIAVYIAAHRTITRPAPPKAVHG